jgi:hypothetical protein
LLGQLHSAAMLPSFAPCLARRITT